MFSSFCSFRWYTNHNYYSHEGNDFFPLAAFLDFLFLWFLAIKSLMGLRVLLFVFFLLGIQSFFWFGVSVLENSWSVLLLSPSLSSPRTPLYMLNLSTFSYALFLLHFFLSALLNSLLLVYSPLFCCFYLLVNPTAKFFLVNANF